MKKNNNILIGGGIVALAVFLTGLYVGTTNSLSMAQTSATVEKNADFTDYWKVWNVLKSDYPFDQPTDKERMEQSIRGLVNSYKDPYTQYFPPTDAKNFLDQIRGDFGGIGVEIDSKKGIITVVSPLKGSPGEKAGIRAGDIIYKVNGEEVTDESVDAVVNKVRGPKGTKVTLTIVREKRKPFDVVIVRDTIKIPTIDTEIVGPKKDIFHIKFYSFSENSAALFADAITRFKKSGAKKLIVDVRGNPGGLLDQCVDIVSHFLPKDVVIVKEGTRDKNEDQSLVSYGTMSVSKEIPIVVLIDKGSASASEILGGALQDHKRAILVGSQSFGKGSVQQLMDIGNDGAKLKMTVAQWFTPNGTQISKKGLTPDITIERTDAEITKKIDSQLNKAIDYLKNK